ncbi:hypothetical protein ACWGR4_30235 [Embleya sp. NPDC055664]
MAESLAAVADRVGAGPGGRLDVRRQLAIGPAPATRFVPVPWPEEGPLHLGTHAGAEAAALIRDDLLEAVTGSTDHTAHGVWWAVARHEAGAADGPTFGNAAVWRRPE